VFYAATSGPAVATFTTQPIKPLSNPAQLSTLALFMIPTRTGTSANRN